MISEMHRLATDPLIMSWTGDVISEESLTVRQANSTQKRLTAMTSLAGMMKTG
jgi:hypothetical protein